MITTTWHKNDSLIADDWSSRTSLESRCESPFQSRKNHWSKIRSMVLMVMSLIMSNCGHEFKRSAVNPGFWIFWIPLFLGIDDSGCNTNCSRWRLTSTNCSTHCLCNTNCNTQCLCNTNCNTIKLQQYIMQSINCNTFTTEYIASYPWREAFVSITK
jgi:hypothetical protein